MLGSTPSQTVGPYLQIGLPWPDGEHAASEDAPGAIRISGHVYDGEGAPVPDAMVETWQADPPPAGDYRGFARAPTNDDGEWWIVTLQPGPVPGPPSPDGTPTMQAPHIDVGLLARGMLQRVVTRIYFADAPDDPVLASVPAERRHTLIATPDGDGAYRFDIRIQGEGETVFFDV